MKMNNLGLIIKSHLDSRVFVCDKNWFNNKLRKIDINHKTTRKFFLATWNSPYWPIIKLFMLALSLVHLSP